MVVPLRYQHNGTITMHDSDKLAPTTQQQSIGNSQRHTPRSARWWSDRRTSPARRRRWRCAWWRAAASHPLWTAAKKSEWQASIQTKYYTPFSVDVKLSGSAPKPLRSAHENVVRACESFTQRIEANLQRWGKICKPLGRTCNWRLLAPKNVSAEATAATRSSKPQHWNKIQKW